MQKERVNNIVGPSVCTSICLIETIKLLILLQFSSSLKKFLLDSMKKLSHCGYIK